MHARVETGAYIYTKIFYNTLSKVRHQWEGTYYTVTRCSTWISWLCTQHNISTCKVAEHRTSRGNETPFPCQHPCVHKETRTIVRETRSILREIRSIVREIRSIV